MSDNPTAAPVPAGPGNEAAAAIPAAATTEIVAPVVPAAPVEAPAAAEVPVADAPVVADVAPAAPATDAPVEQPATAAPTYTDFKFPEGMAAAPAVLTEATKLFGELGLPQEGAQKLVDFHTAQVKQAVDGFLSTATDHWNQKSKDWVKEFRADPDIGGNRADTSRTLANSALRDLVPDNDMRSRLATDLADTKIGDHPILVRAFREAGHRFQQVMQATGAATWAEAMKKLREASPRPPGQPARVPGATGRAADRRYTPKQ